MEQKISGMNGYFEEQIALCARREAELAADGRADEASFEKVKANICDIFRTILSVAVKTGGGDEAAVRRFFVQKVQQIPSAWEAAYDAAKQHNDPVRMRLEQIKLETAREISAKFAAIWEE